MLKTDNNTQLSLQFMTLIGPHNKLHTASILHFIAMLYCLCEED